MLPEDSIPLVSAILLAGSTAWHPDYARVVAHAVKNRRLATGDVGPLLGRFTQRETEEEFRARLDLYVATSQSTWRELSTPFYQVARLKDGQVERKLIYDEALGDEERARRIERAEGALGRFYDNKPLQDYLAEHVARTVGMTDPNAWVLTEFGAFDFRTQQARPYPVLLPCEAVIHFTRQAGAITSMSARYVVSSDDTSAALYRYTTYLPDHAIDYWPLDGKGSPTIPGGPQPSDGAVLTDGGDLLYHYRVFEHGAGRVPALPVGYVLDEGAVGHVFITPLAPALPFLELELKTGSELQIVMRNMAMPRQLQYVQPCSGIIADGGCTAGLCTSPRDGNLHDLTCRKCKGSGQELISTSARDVITVPLSPDPTENKLKLTDMLAFVGPDPAVPQFQIAYQDWISALAKQKLFGTPVLSKTTVTQTATERLSQLDQLNIALTPFADQFSGLYAHIATVAATFVDAGDGLTVVYDFPDDLQLKSLVDLYAELQLAIAAGARADEVDSIQNAIARKRHASDPEALRRYYVRSRFIPFLGLPDAMVIQLGSLGWVTDDDRIVRFNSDRIFADIEQANPKFYDLPYDKQAQAVADQVAKIKAALPPAAGSAFPRISMNPTATPAPAVPAAA